MAGYEIIKANKVKDYYEGTDVPGEFRSLTKALGSKQLAATLIRIPAHSDFEQSTGHYHDKIEELYIITKGTLTMRFNDDIKKVGAGSVVRISPKTKRSHRNEGNTTVEMWAISIKNNHKDAHKIDYFWKASKKARQHR